MTDSDFGLSPVEALFEFAKMRGDERDELLRHDNIAVAARLAKRDPERFKDLLDALGSWPSTRRLRLQVDKVLAQAADDRPRIHASETDLSRTLDEAEAALASRAENLFQTNGRLVHLTHHNKVGADDAECTEEEITDSTAPIRRPSGALVIEEVSTHLLVEQIAKAARWFKFDRRAKPRMADPDDPDKRGAYVPGRPSLEIAKHITARGQWPIRVLRGTVETPTLRQSGSILQRPGYDRRSQLYFDDNGVAFPFVPKEPTREDALVALAMLKDVLKDFPFVPDDGEDWGGTSAARSVALSALLTGLVRRSLATAPAHGIDAPVMGTGKTKIAEIASTLATGRTPTAISQGKTPEEFNKRLFATLLAGDAVIIIDNIEADIESDEFCTVLTSESVQNRILGLSQMATVATNSLFVLNGNRMTFKGDITARVTVCNLDARMEDPRTRTFDREPVAYTLANRPELVVAGLTAMRAHVVAGFTGTKGLVPSRFPDWDRMVRAALIWLGEPDPQLTAEKVVSVDPVRDSHSALLRAWEEAIGPNHWVKAKDIIERSEAVTAEDFDKFDWPPNTPWPDEAVSNLADALSSALESRIPNARSLGKYLKKYDGRIYSGLAIHAAQDRENVMRFALKKQRES